MKSLSPFRLGRKAVRAASGGVIVIVALLALLFMQGPGTGDGESEETSTTPGNTQLTASADATSAMLTSSQDAAAPTDEPTEEQLTAAEQAALSDNTLIVLIDEHDFVIRIPEGDSERWEPIELERLTEIAQKARGDSNGIRVRIEKRVTARASAEQRILSALKDVGIGSDAVFESSELIE